MSESFIYSVNAVLPIFLIVALGIVLRKIKFLDDTYCRIADRMVFKLALPVNLFLSTYSVDIRNMFNKNTLKLVVFNVSALTVVFVLLCVFVPLFLKDKPKCGSFIQGAFRSNFAIFAIPMVQNLFPENGKEIAAVLLPFVVILFNVYAVIDFSLFYDGDEKQQVGKKVVGVLKKTATNPLIIGIVLGLIFAVISQFLIPVTIPAAITKALTNISDMAIPLALLSIGVGFKTEDLKGRLGLAVCSSVGKTIIVPVIVLAFAIFMGFRGVELAVVLVVFGSPTAVSSYVMAKRMNGDSILAAQILLIGTVFSLFSMFILIFLLKQFSFI